MHRPSIHWPASEQFDAHNLRWHARPAHLWSQIHKPRLVSHWPWELQLWGHEPIEQFGPDHRRSHLHTPPNVHTPCSPQPPTPEQSDKTEQSFPVQPYSQEQLSPEQTPCSQGPHEPGDKRRLTEIKARGFSPMAMLSFRDGIKLWVETKIKLTRAINDASKNWGTRLDFFRAVFIAVFLNENCWRYQQNHGNNQSYCS